MENYLPAPVELELQRRPPRTTANRGGTWGTIKPFLIFLVPHVWIAVAAPFVLASFYVSYFSSEPFPGTVVEKHSYPTKSHSTNYNIDAEFAIGEKKFRASGTVPQAVYDSHAEGDPITVYAARLNPELFNRLDKNSSESSGLLLFGTLWVTIWCSVTFSVVWLCLSQPLRSKQLVKDGTAILGTLDSVDKETNRNGTRYKVTYSYVVKQLDAKTGRTGLGSIKSKMYIRKSDLDAARELQGKPVTVLIDEKHPKRSILYQFCDDMAVN